VVLLVVSDWVVLLVVETDACLAGLAHSLVGQCVQKVYSLIHHNFVLNVGVLLILQLEVVGREDLDGQVGSADGALVTDDVGCLSHSAVGDVVKVRLVCCHGYDNLISEGLI
jgi:hypothetical protein